MPLKRIDRSSLVIQYAIAAAKMAVEHARLDMAQEKADRVGVIIATSGAVSLLGDQGDILKLRGPNRIDPCWLIKSGLTWWASE